MPTGCRSVYLLLSQQPAVFLDQIPSAGMRYLLVISKVVPKIWARTNSAIIDGGRSWRKRGKKIEVGISKEVLYTQQPVYVAAAA